MNKLFIIGNGFDLAHGNKTSYLDFFSWYFQKCIKKEDWKRADEDPHIFVLEGSLYCFIRSDQIKLEEFISRFDGNNWQWDKRKISGANWVNEANKKFKIQPHNTHTFEIFPQNDFCRKLLMKSTTTWVDIEEIFFEELIEIYEKYFKRNSTQKNNFELGKEHLNNLNNSLNSIKKELVCYLKSIEKEQKIFDQYFLKLFINEIEKELLKDSRLIQIPSFTFLSFNYTNTIHNYLDRLVIDTKTNPSQFPLRNLIEIISIHGDINKSPEEIVFGFGDILHDAFPEMEKTNENAFFKNIKLFDYLKFSEYKKLETFINRGEYEAIVMGHSCGLSDRILLNKIFENENCRKIKIHYHYKSENENDFIEKTMNISRQFKPINKEKLLDKILPFSELVKEYNKGALNKINL